MWTLNLKDSTVALRNVDVLRFELDRVLISHGLDTGEMVVTAGVQALRPGQQVRLPGVAPVVEQGAEPRIELGTGPGNEAAK